MIVETFHTVLTGHTAGSPTQEEVVWTNLTLTDIAQRMAEYGTVISTHIVEQLLDLEGYHRRKIQKTLPMGQSQDRDAQFLNIERLTQQYLDSGDPILSMDSKRRELLGSFYRPGRLYTRQVLAAFDHDFPSSAEGVVIPHGLYDPRLNRGYVHLGTSHDTSAFACDCVADWWYRFGSTQYSGAKSLLLKCDGGGSNSASTYLFKADLQRLVNQLGLEVRVLHYPPYCSKYNPIEHRLFCHLSRVCQGVMFSSMELVRQLMSGARTRTGLNVVVDIVDKVYETGRKVAEEVKQGLNLLRDTFLPKLNYRILPQM
jgi:Rhodopirellula transposase DDE domain